MRKQMKKKLYTLYTVEGTFDDISNDKEHKLVSYSSGKAECIRYHKNIIDWVIEIVTNKFKNGFGIKVVTEDGNHKVNIHRYDLECNTYTCNNESEEYVIRRMNNMISFYLDADPYYYEIDDDVLIMREEFTGHIYYRSPYESCDNCGTCDGARCDYCKEKYTVENLRTNKVYYNGFDKEKAKRIKIDTEKDYSQIAMDIVLNYDIDLNLLPDKIDEKVNYKSLLNLINIYKIPYVNIY